jgi:hypothetical protein
LGLVYPGKTDPGKTNEAKEAGFSPEVEYDVVWVLENFHPFGGVIGSDDGGICSKTGALHAFVPASDFTLEKGEGEQTDYQFNKKVIHHEFCKTCGIRSFSHGSSPNGEMIGINARCLDNVDPDTLTIQHFDGKNS